MQNNEILSKFVSSKHKNIFLTKIYTYLWFLVLI